MDGSELPSVCSEWSVSGGGCADKGCLRERVMWETKSSKGNEGDIYCDFLTFAEHGVWDGQSAREFLLDTIVRGCAG